MTLVVIDLNCRGQTGFTKTKQLIIESEAINKKLDVIHLQEVKIDDKSFESCDFLKNQFQIFANNSENGCYGTCSLVHTKHQTENVKIIPGGRIICLDVNGATLLNVYMPSGSAGMADREDLAGRVLPSLLLDAAKHGICGGDFNAVISAKDATHNYKQKLSSGLQKTVSNNKWQDCFRSLHPDKKAFSFVYKRHMGASGLCEGAAQLDRCYFWGPIRVSKAEYLPAAFSDHLAHHIEVILPGKQEVEEPTFKPYFKIKPEIARDPDFHRLAETVLQGWLPAKNRMCILQWWDLFKKELRQSAKKFSYEKKKEKGARLTYLMLLQAHLAGKVEEGDIEQLDLLRDVQAQIISWFEQRAEEVELHANIRDSDESEKIQSYHYDKLNRVRKRSSILKLKTKNGELVSGHAKCADLLNKEALELMSSEVDLDERAQRELLEQVDKVFTDQDNQMLDKPITNEEVWESLLRANRSSSPGSDSISYSVYIHCWPLLGPLCDVIRAVVEKGRPTESMKHSLLLFAPKNGKESSLLIKDKRKLAMLQTDHKILSGILAERLRKTENHTLSPFQYAASHKRVTHAICQARNALELTKNSNKGVAFYKTDFEAAFDRMCV